MASVKNFHHPGDLDPSPAIHALTRLHPRSRRAQLRKTLTWDRGKELSDHAQFSLETGTQVYFADPHSPWQRPTNENTNGVLRQYFPKGTDLTRWSALELEAVAYTLNNRPRKVLGWRTPAEVFADQLHSLDNTGVATTS